MFSNDQRRMWKPEPAIRFTQLSLAYEIITMYKKQKVNANVKKKKTSSHELHPHNLFCLPLGTF